MPEVGVLLIYVGFLFALLGFMKTTIAIEAFVKKRAAVRLIQNMRAELVIHEHLYTSYSKKVSAIEEALRNGVSSQYVIVDGEQVYVTPGLWKFYKENSEKLRQNIDHIENMIGREEARLVILQKEG